MLTKENLQAANELIKTVPIKGKEYAPVSERVRAFRTICPGGQITTEIISIDNGVVTMKATIIDESGRVISTGLAQEKENASTINKTSFIENCETSAVGRALGMAGIGISGGIASAEEVRNAIYIQNQSITDKEKLILENMCKNKGYSVEEIFPNGLNLTNAQYVEAVQTIDKFPAKK